MFMIDWALVLFPCLHTPINAGQVISVNSDGSIDWASPKRFQVSGSFEKKVSVKSVGGDGTGQATHIWFNGNPSKFLQGHNVFGSSDLRALLFDVYISVVKQLGITPTDIEVRQVKEGAYPLKMVDINGSFSLPSQSDVQSFIRALEFKAKTRSGRPSSKGGTLYFGKTSQRWALKFYSKFEEIKKKDRQLPLALQNRGIEDWVSNKLRIELRLLSKELQLLGIKKVNHIAPQNIGILFDSYVRRIDMSEQIQLTDEVLAKLPNKLRLTYTAWTEGHDLRSMMSKATYYRHKDELKQFGINLDLPVESTQKTNVVPLVNILEAKPASVPDWAFDQNFIHSSAVNF